MSNPKDELTRSPRNIDPDDDDMGGTYLIGTLLIVLICIVMVVSMAWLCIK